MRHHFRFWRLCIGALSLCHFTGVALAQEKPDAVVPGISDLFSRCELDALVARYSASVEFTSPSTKLPLVGHSELAKYFANACDGKTFPVMRVESQRVTLLSTDAAVVTGTYSFGRSDRPKEKPWPAFFVITTVRSGNSWLIQTQATFAVPE